MDVTALTVMITNSQTSFENHCRNSNPLYESDVTWTVKQILTNRVFSHDVTAAILVSQNNETAAMLVSQTSPVGVELFSYVNAFFCSNKFA